IRRRHDRQVRRWMPHLTLVYPFRPREEFGALEGPLAGALRGVAAFELELKEFRSFPHGPRSVTAWLAPEPEEPVAKLEAALRAVVPDCDDQTGYAGGFHPHLSVGQLRGGPVALAMSLAGLQTAWTPLRFTVSEVNLIARGEPPDDVFR